MGTWWTGGVVLAAVAIGQACGSTVRNAAVEEVSRGMRPERTTVAVDPVDPTSSPWTTAVTPKPLGDAALAGLTWLLETQRSDGGWSQGEESRHMGADGELAGRSNVADTCISLLALLRASPSPSEGPYAQAVRRAAGFVCGSVEASDEDSLYVTDVRGTRVQSKIGTYVDTFFASLVLAELKGRTGDEALDARVTAALAKVVAKIERNQQADGGFEGQGWAPVLSQSIAGKGLNRALQAGARVSADTLVRNQAYFRELGTASEAPAPGSAGVMLYSSSAGLAGLQEYANSGAQREGELKRQLAASDDDEERAKLRSELERIEDGREAQRQVQEAMLGRLDDEAFVSGFGSNGGEEFLSYLNISESLVVRADQEWRAWDASMAANLERVQNEDGSWSGHHCITGRNFCTAAALLVLLADRTPVPAELVAEAR